LREFSTSTEDFDKKIADEILLTAQEADDKESHEIWKYF
jgi:hypothetical protein